MEVDANISNDIHEETITRLHGTEEILKLNHICRVCLCETDEGDEQLDTRIILLLNHDQEIRSLLQESTGVKIIDSVFLPNYICDNCLKTLRAWFTLRSQTQLSNEILEKYLKELRTSLEMQDEKLNVLEEQNLPEIQHSHVSVEIDEPEVVRSVFHCNSCTKKFTNKVDLDKHQEDHIKLFKQLTFKCEHCPKSFAFHKGMHNHMKLAHHHCKGFKCQCDVCEKSFHSLTALKNHKRKPCVPVNLIKQCRTRQSNVRKKQLLAAAKKAIQQNKRRRISCILCKKNFRRYDTFTAHFPKCQKDRKCPICYKNFTTCDILETHLRMHLRAKVYTCPICSRPFYSFPPFRNHMRQHSKREWVYRCNMCEKEFFLTKEFNTHMVKHFEAIEDEKRALEKVKHNKMSDVEEIEIDNRIKDVNECDSNTSAADDSDDLKNETTNKIPIFQELVKVEEDSEVTAPSIPKNDTSFQVLMDCSTDVIDSTKQLQSKETESQVQSSSPLESDIPIDNENSYEACQSQSVDSNQFNTNTKLQKTELNLRHPTLDNSSSEEETQDEIDDDNISNLSKSSDQINENQFAENTQMQLWDKYKVNCHVTGCQTKVSTFPNIWQHFKKVHISVKKPYRCSICSEKFGNRKLLRAHIIKYYSYQCPVCHKYMPNYSELKNHMIKSHYNARPFKCSKCGKKFGRRSYLNNHKFTHSKKEAFHCSICPKAYFSRNGLQLHSKSHKVIKELQCLVCGKQYSSKFHLKRHINLNICSQNRTKSSVRSLENENNGLEEAQQNDMAVDKEIDNSNNIEIGNEGDSNKSPGNDSNTCLEPLILIKVEKDSDGEGNTSAKDLPIQVEMNFPSETIDSKQQLHLIKTETQVNTVFQLDPEILTNHESSYKASQCQNVDTNELNTDSTEVKKKRSVSKNIVTLKQGTVNKSSLRKRKRRR